MSRFLSFSRPIGFLVLLGCFSVAWLSAEDAPEKQDPKFSFSMSAALGAETIEKVNYQYLSLVPDFGYGPWGVGVDLSFHFEFLRDDQFGFYPRAKDWWDPDQSLGRNIDKYLARLAYLRYGHKGEDLYAQIGLLPATTLGSGFIVSNYNNGILRPDIRLTGLNLDASGALFGAPWIGMESFVGSISTFNLIGTRVWTKPFTLAGVENPILKNTQVGVTGVVDTNPNANTTGSSPGTVAIFGADAMAPLVSSELFTALGSLDLTAQGSNVGSALGVSGTAVKFLFWGVQLRALGDNFLTNYVDRGYEISRAKKYEIYKGTVKVPGTLGYQTTLGTSFLGDAVVMGFTFAGPFGSTSNLLAQPQLTGFATVKPGLLPVDVNAYYLKRGVTSFDKLISPADALIGAKVGWTMGAVTLSVVYDLRYVESSSGNNNWVTTSRIETAVKMF